MSKMIFFDLEARNKMKKGVDTLANAVKVTLGPKGRNVVIEKKFGSPSITKDGVSVAKEIDLEDPIENIGAQMVVWQQRLLYYIHSWCLLLTDVMMKDLYIPML